MPKVMVIDDEPFILMMIEDKLQRGGIEVVTLRESKNAVDVIRREMPDLIILDWMMPEISGISICKTIKTDPELASIPVFKLTAKGQEDDEKLGIECGVDRYITKPFSPRILLELVLEQLGNK
ncbi:alkaline phosphatase synthesis transcriptional regulatory protein PhoP [bacterium BMS3Bbin07]|nr:alkaline phosphatase synthesis transcriptional regulatory protein PhoP [bacterium BMS3Bbin07]